MSVNDLQNQWNRDYLQLCEDGETSIAGGVARCAHDLRDTTRIAWRSIIEPPAESDGNALGEVAFAYCKCGEWIVWTGRWDRSDSNLLPPPDMWAHTRNVVLLPSEVE